MPLKSLEEEFKVSWTREVLIYRDSRDRRWPRQEVYAESRLRHIDLVGVVAHGRVGLGMFCKGCKGMEKQRQIQEEVRAAVEEGRSSRVAGLRQQVSWTRWEQAMDQKVTWMDVWQTESHCITFLIRAVYDVLPNPANLFTWGKVETLNCPLEHILSSCATALGQGHYTWHDYQVLKPIAEAISKRGSAPAAEGATPPARLLLLRQ